MVTSPDLVVLSRFVEIVNNGYAFSDGCGVMGTDVARAIQETLGQTKLPGAVQVRVGYHFVIAFVCIIRAKS